MRKKRKEAADVSAVSAPPPTSPPVKAAEQPTCLFCSRAPAQDIQATHLPGKEPAVFCSLHCAAAWAVGLVHKERIEWCEKHKRWTETKRRCHACKLESEGYSPLLAGNHSTAQGVESEVQP